MVSFANILFKVETHVTPLSPKRRLKLVREIGHLYTAMSVYPSQRISLQHKITQKLQEMGLMQVYESYYDEE